MRAKSVTAVLITSFAFSNLLQNAALLFISPRPRNVPLPEIFSQTVSIAGVITPVRNLITIVASIVLLAGVANAVQAGQNGALSKGLAESLTAGLVVAAGTATCILVVGLLSGRLTWPTVDQAMAMPWWASA